MAQVLITGSSDGLGLLSARKLVAGGHRVILHARNEERAGYAINQLPEAGDVLIGDLSSIEETRQLAARANELGPFDAIIQNAGIFHVPHEAKSKDDLPLLFAVNSLAPYILTALIDRPERMIYLSSGMHRQGNASREQLATIPEGKYYPSYSDTKLHDLILALAVTRIWPDVISNAVDPGWVPTKMGGRNATDDLDKGYETQVWLASSEDKEAKIGGRFLFHKKAESYNQQANDPEVQEMFLKVCEKITGLQL